MNEIHPKYPELKVDLSKCHDVFDIEGKVHGQMKHHGFDKSIRREFTHAIQKSRTWDEVLLITKTWVTVVVEPISNHKNEKLEHTIELLKNVKIYAVRLRSEEGCGCIVKVNNDEITHHIKHSPTGMEMGYAGSGPADMAYSILRHLFSKVFAERWHQKFKWDFVSQWKGDDINITLDLTQWDVPIHKSDLRIKE